MTPLLHLLISLILAAVFYPIFNLKVLLILAGGVLIDMDHYLFYICRFKDFNIKNCYKYCHAGIKNNNFKDTMGMLLIFHNIEFLLISIIFSIYYQLALMFTIGLVFHYIMDITHRYSLAKSIISSPSLIVWFIKNKIR
jgi:hypothetical protein|tara:strand:+ start:660 stop:1076 length:417 start_codon:yes stop_codon:yes gene_type:complete